jgi:transposase-like protein
VLQLPERLATRFINTVNGSMECKPMGQANPFTWRHDHADIILLCVRWYFRSSLSYRDLEEMMVERGLRVDHTTVYRWVNATLQSWNSASSHI